ncbi:hypothetical protein G6011_04068 [Alternaria panax]|uniref:Uncharacterized protein n=1 Tax=Alternaria panax TaxID=48097 RepID=A0AAD4NTN3_9PLEO|nr:hypothetical protein G6011_04068 [Alternaria panax]
MANSQPRPQLYMTNYDLSQHTQEPPHFAKVNQQVGGTFFNSTDMEASDLGMYDALLGKVVPDILALAVHTQDTILDSFGPDNTSYKGVNTNISRSLGLPWVVRDESIMQFQQQQQPWYQQGQNPYSHMSIDLCDRNMSCVPQAPQGNSPLLHSSMRLVQQSYAQTQTPWMKQQSPSHGQRMQCINQQQMPMHLFKTPHPTTPFPAPRYTTSASQTAPLSHEMAGDKRVFKKSSDNNESNKASATSQGQPSASAKSSAKISQPIAAAAPQAIQFTSFAQAQKAAATRVVPHNYTPSTNDPSFPKDDAAQKAYIRQMYDAYVDITGCIDRATVPNFDSHFSTLSSDSPTSPITPLMISTICWHLLTIATDLHTRGPICLNVYDPAKLKNVYKHRNLRFDARIDAICTLLRMSKSRCASLLSMDGLGMVVANAPVLCRQSRTNHTNNGHRQDYLETGKDVVAGQDAAAGKKRGGCRHGWGR